MQLLLSQGTDTLIKVSELLCLEPLTDCYCSAAYKPKSRREDTAAARA